MKLIPGWVLLLLVGLISSYLSEFVVVGGKHPLEASAVAIVLGILLCNFVSLPKFFDAGIKAAEKLLVVGIVLLGAALNVSNITAQGLPLLRVIVGTMSSGFLLIFFLGRWFLLSESLALLLAVGTAICGTSAIAITAPLIKAQDEETSYAVATVALWGLVAILVYPLLARMLQVPDFIFGVFAGTAIHSTPQVVGAGYIYSDFAGQTATAVKLVRNCFMAPLAIVVALLYRRKGEGAVSNINFAKAFPWFVFGYFLFARCSTKGYFTKEGVDAFSAAGKFLILLGMAGIGFNTSIASFRNVGFRPLIVSGFGTALLAVVGAAMIWATL